MKINNITEKDLGILKQLDRIEFRQKKRDCEISHHQELLCLVASMFFLLLSTSYNVSGIVSKTEAMVFVIISIFFSISAIIVILIQSKWRKENFEGLNQEYFRIEKN